MRSFSLNCYSLKNVSGSTYVKIGNKSIAFSQQISGAGKDPSTFVEINTPEHVLKIDCSDMHGKVVGDAWFGKSV